MERERRERERERVGKERRKRKRGEVEVKKKKEKGKISCRASRLFLNAHSFRAPKQPQNSTLRSSPFVSTKQTTMPISDEVRLFVLWPGEKSAGA